MTSILRWLKTRRADLLCIAVLAAVTCAVFWQAFVQPTEMIREDAAYYYQPYYVHAAREVQAGRFPLWNPYTHAGLPFHASFQPSLLYPLRWPAFFMDYVPAYLTLLMSHFFLGGVSAYFLMRGALRVKPLAGLLGALSIAFGGFAMGHMTHFTYFLAYPWFFGAITCVWLGVHRSDWRWALGAGACIGLMALIGAVHLLLILMVLLGVFVVFQTLLALLALRGDSGVGWTAVVRPAATVLAAGVLGGLIGAAQLLPAKALMESSVRMEASWEYVNMACAHPVDNTAKLVAPYLFGNSRLGYWGEYNFQGMAHFTGVFMLVAAVVGVASIGRDRRLWFWPVLAVVGFLVSAGEYLPVYRVLYDHVPVFGQLRNPTRIFWVTEIAIACLGALGIDRAFRNESKPTRRVKLAAGVAAGAVLLILAVSLAYLHHWAANPDAAERLVQQNPKIPQSIWKPGFVAAAREVPGRILYGPDPAAWVNIVAGLVGVVTIVFFVRRGSGGRLAAVVLVGILAAELIAFSFGTVQYERGVYRVITETPDSAAWLRARLGLQRYVAIPPSPRPSPDDVLLRNRAMQYGIRSAHGKGGGILDSPRRQQFMMLVQQYPAYMNVAGVKYLLTPGEVEHPAMQPVRQDARYHYYQNTGCMPPAWFVPRLIAVDGSQEAARAIVSKQFDPRRVAVIDGILPAETSRSRATQAEAQALRTVPGRWEIDVNTDAPAQLVVQEGYDPGWRCRIGDDEVEVYRTYDQLISVPVPGGEHTVVLEYAPANFTRGLAVSATGLVLLLAAGSFAVWRRRREPASVQTEAPDRKGKRRRT